MNNNEKIKEVKEKVKQKETKIKERIEESEAKEKENVSTFTSFIKIALFIVEIVFGIVLLLCLGALFFSVYISITSKLFLGLIMLFTSMILVDLWIMVFIGKIIMDKKLKLIKSFVMLFIIIMFTFSSIIVIAKDFSDIKVIKNNVQTAKLTETIKLSEIFRTEIDDMEVPTIVFDNTLDNEVKVEVEYYDEVGKIQFIKESEGVYDISYIESFNKVYKTFFDNIKNDKILDYEALEEIKVTLYVNEKDINKLNLDDGYVLNGQYIKSKYSLVD